MRAAARIICVKRSIRRALRCSIQFVGSKPFSSQAKWTANSDGSKASIGAAPDWPSTRFVQNVSTSLPSGVTAPMPVITTRLRPLTEAMLDPQSAVHEQHVARDERGLVGAEKAYRSGNVLRRPEPAERRIAEDEPGLLLGEDVGQ